MDDFGYIELYIIKTISGDFELSFPKFVELGGKNRKKQLFWVKQRLILISYMHMYIGFCNILDLDVYETKYTRAAVVILIV